MIIPMFRWVMIVCLLPLVTWGSELVQLRSLGATACQGTGVSTVLLHIQMAPGWHLYWVNPGEAGKAPEWQVDPIWQWKAQWPVPNVFDSLGVRGYGYEDDLLVPGTIRCPVAPTSSVPLTIRLRWVACRDTCVSGASDVGVPIPRTTAPQPQLMASLQAAHQALPRVSSQPMYPTIQGDRWRLPAHPSDTPIPYDPQLVWEGEVNGQWQWVARGPIQDRRILIRHANGKGTTHKWVIPSPTPSVTQQLLVMGLACLGGLVGGLLLNVMPCVFPVLSLKLMALIQQEDRRTRRVHLMATVAGIGVSFLVLILVMVGFRAMGHQIGWGFQLQHPLVIAGLVLGLSWMALNLMGWFEIGLGLTRIQLGHQGHWGAFFNGVLTTVVATPCTGPFLGGAMGVALTQPVWVGVLVMMSVGIGVSLPYLVLMGWPSLHRWLPRPGAWMQRVKEGLSFPLWLTVVWLLWVLAAQTNGGVVARVGVCMVAVAALSWWLGVCQANRWTIRGWGAWVGLLLVLGVGLMSPMRQHHDPIERIPFSESVFNGSIPTLVVFTADWCVTCQVNERVLFTHPGVMAAIQERGIRWVIADWPHADPVVGAALQRVGRQSVPTMVWWASPDVAPVVLPSVMTPSQLMTYLQQAPLKRRSSDVRP